MCQYNNQDQVNYINFFFESTNFFEYPENIIKIQVLKIIEDSFKSVDEINIIFCNDKYLLELNNRYLGSDYYTDIITFNNSIDNLISGDLYISIDRIKENSIQYGASFIYELARVIYHGILHLVGFNDKSALEKKIMRQKEDYYLKNSDLENLINGIKI